jgi:single-strand DNA-binding protein
MSSVNRVILIGRVGQDVEVKYMPNGDAVANWTLATSEQWKDKNTGEKRETTEWHRLTTFRRLAEIVGEYVKKGSLIYVEGKLQTRKWTDKENVERYTTEILVDQMKMLGSKPNGGDDQDEPREQRNAPGGSRPRNQSPAPRSTPSFSDMDDDIPFANPYRGKIGLSI